MWKRVLVLVILALIYPVIESKRRKSDSAKLTKCQRTNSKAFRYCTQACSSNDDCKSNEKCLCDGDCGLSCVKNNLRCDAPPGPKKSRQDLSNDRYFGSVVTYSCSRPYKLRGSAKRTCRAIREWDGKKARCKIMCNDPGEIPFGNRRYDGSQAGKYIQYWCYDAYKLVGSARITCLNTGKWSAPRPTCELPSCIPPVIPDYASVYYPRKMPKRFRHSDVILLKCKDGYFKLGTGSLKCQGGDIWKGKITCSPKSCGRPSDIFNGRIIGYVYTFKEKVRYTCDEGYTLNGPAYRQCQANERWSGEDPICEVVNCGSLKKPDHGEIIEQVALTFGNRIVFECNVEGYEMKGSRIRTCQSDGVWSGSLTTCELVKCGDPGKPTNGKQIVNKGYMYGGSVTFVCDMDYTLMGKDITYCQTDKSWSVSVPRCLAPCPDPGFPYQGNRIDEDFHHGHTVRFTCPRNYVMEGVSAIRCSDGQWNNNKPSCKAPCVEPANPAHGWRWGQDFRHRHSVTFSCSRGYQKVGASPIKCNDGTWDNQFPVCKGVCGRPATPLKGSLHGNSFLDGDEVTFSCDVNYDLFGNAKLHCAGRTWDSRVPQCKARCMFSGRPNNGNSNEGSMNRGDMIKHGVQITYSCNRYYTLVGSNKQECNNGHWTNDRPLCKASCQSPGGMAHGSKIGNDYGHGKTVKYKCNRGYTLEGQNQLTCGDGSWNFHAPNCRESCLDPGAPNNGQKRGDNFRHGSWVEFLCDANYQLNGDKSIQCRDGSWRGSVPNCIAVCPDPGKPAKGRRLNNDFQDGKTVTFKCNPNHDLIGNKTIQCNGGFWSDDKPKCKGRCTFNGTPLNGFTPNQVLIQGTSLPHDSSVEYACKVSYTLTGSKVLNCSDGQWNDVVPSCNAPCGDPGLLDHGSKNGEDYSHGQTVTYGCISGYSLVGSDQLTCDNGKWDSTPPLCKASCQATQEPSNGKIHNNGTKHGALISFSCNDGYQLQGLKQIACFEGKWNGSAPTCRGSCKDPGPLNNGQIIGNSYTYGSILEFRCNAGYRLRGSKFASCVKGTWSETIPECRKSCWRPETPQNGWITGNNYAHGGVITFGCKNRNYDLIGASRITCKDGEWSDSTPTCETRCNNPGKPDNGAKDGDNYRSGAIVTFRCNPPFELVGSHMIVCRNGKWSDFTPTCSNCSRSLGMENSGIQNYRITTRHYYQIYHPRNARLNGRSSWCTSIQTFLQIDFGRTYKVTAIATQGGTRLGKWVKGYKIGFKAGATIVIYSESGSQKTIDGNKDASSVVKYQFRGPFVTRTVLIYPEIDASPVCLRTEIYGCDPSPADCILVGSMFWGLWTQRQNSSNYYKAYITKLYDTRIEFALETNNKQKHIYRRTDPVLIIDNIPEMKDISVNARVIAVHDSNKKEWYRTGTVIGTSGARSVSVRFDNGDQKWVQLNELRLVKRPRFCKDRI